MAGIAIGKDRVFGNRDLFEQCLAGGVIDGFYREIAQSDISSQKRGCSQIRSREFSFCCSVRLFAGIRETTLFQADQVSIDGGEFNLSGIDRMLFPQA